jgi:hypothetical protein
LLSSSPAITVFGFPPRPYVRPWTAGQTAPPAFGPVNRRYVGSFQRAFTGRPPMPLLTAFRHPSLTAFVPELLALLHPRHSPRHRALQTLQMPLLLRRVVRDLAVKRA